MEIIKKETVWSNVPESEEDTKDTSLQSDICIATKTDGKPCQGIKYKDNDLCYSHLMKSHCRPRGRPCKKVVDVSNSIVALAPQPVAPSSAGNQVVAPEPIRPPSRVPSPRTAGDDLLTKLSNRLRVKVESLDDEMKVLLKMLL